MPQPFAIALQIILLVTGFGFFAFLFGWTDWSLIIALAGGGLAVLWLAAVLRRLIFG